ncbi:CDP-diacylglycerol--glycerol-3-phosphate 3-phosphatidyltransferase [Paracoccus fistulariae]|uniref:CDP-diacylglycerol--glycerol-3-phosphate 3-phosphatidyltransferase n=1 Tax=Paracoccus fistulariae TaxID=658446 RepID=A0ABY7SG41_9RHOB|nr:CDP-diacylglycerol--glycerol-3-phosphate 3-phosphatidyltransferase [Paracoccus fistulariae]MDB6181713.1 CDP-diacylglycerol--glycerol-3-phosphate 3-phosphatidyltransferase [Paracoccus fistulariae]WCR05987.1 CDP-diacylglycerol--glycerol-3-phosphate 3-phosphatidyltransferase [Paracoccus fistulariae]
MRWTIPNILTLLRLIAAPAVPLMFLYFSRPFADWAALVLFIVAAVTDWFDGYIARAWKLESRFGAAMDPIADKAMVVIAIVVITGYSGMNPWLILPATIILFREVFVSGLREFLGANAKLLKVTKLAKWKTTFQMVAIAVLFLGTGLAYVERGQPPLVGEAELPLWMDSWADVATSLGLLLIWLAAGLTFWTGWDYFVKALPYLKEPGDGA